MIAPRLHYVYDPLCGLCYAAAPLVQAASDAGISVSLHGGGLWGSPTGLSPSERDYIRQSDERITSLTDQPFGPAYLDGLLNDPSTVLWSQPPIAAVLAAGSIEASKDLMMLHAIQHAHYVSGRRVVELGVLMELASEIGLPDEAFQEAFEGMATEGHIAHTRRWMQQIGLTGFPGLTLEGKAGLVRVRHESFYGHPEAFVRAISDLIPTLAIA